MEIFFEILVDDLKYIDYQNLMHNLDLDVHFKTELLSKNRRGLKGKVIIRYYEYAFVIDEEFVSTVLFRIFINAAFCVLSNETYQNTLEAADNESIVFDYTDSGEIGVRIRHYGVKHYFNDKSESVFRSGDNYMLQEIIIPKDEFIEKSIICAEKFISYRDILHMQATEDTHLEFWRVKVSELKHQWIESNHKL